MACNKVQFQKSPGLHAFIQQYSAEAQCFDALRWPDGFKCPACGHDKSCRLNTRKLQQCNRCHRQTSLTVFEATKLSLTPIYLIIQDKKGISAMKLHRHLGISYNAARLMKQKLMQFMMEREHDKPLSGFIELDDAYPGGERTGCKPGRGAVGKTPFVAAVETTDKHSPVRIKLTKVKGFRSAGIRSWSGQRLAQGSIVISDGLACFNAVVDEGCGHDRIVCGGGRAPVEEPEFYWVNTILGNLKSALRSSYHSVRLQYAQRYLSEFADRFNRRFDLPGMIPGLAHASLRIVSMPEKLLKSGFE